jgi:hypothetical protein
MGTASSWLRAPLRLAIFLAAFAVMLPAQWPPQPKTGVPKNADGSPNFEGPAPRTPDGKPDLSGFWRVRWPKRSGAAAAPPNPATQDRSNPFWDIGIDMKGGLPFTPLGAEIHKRRLDDNGKDNPEARCLPLGLMQLHNQPLSSQWIQTPGMIVILYEVSSNVRKIYTDGRSLPKNDPQPWWYGYSVGKWEGDTLVVDTIGFRDDVWLDILGSPLTSTGKMTERFRRVNYGNMEIDVTVEDPKVYTKPWTVHINQRTGEEPMEYICEENEKDVQHFVGK